MPIQDTIELTINIEKSIDGLLLGFLLVCISPNSNMEKNANIFVIAALDLLHISGFSFVASQLESTGRAFSFEVEMPHC